jgi:hypothetical protein
MKDTRTIANVPVIALRNVFGEPDTLLRQSTTATDEVIVAENFSLDRTNARQLAVILQRWADTGILSTVATLPLPRPTPHQGEALCQCGHAATKHNANGCFVDWPVVGTMHTREFCACTEFQPATVPPSPSVSHPPLVAPRDAPAVPPPDSPPAPNAGRVKRWAVLDRHRHALTYHSSAGGADKWIEYQAANEPLVVCRLVELRPDEEIVDSVEAEERKRLAFMEITCETWASTYENAKAHIALILGDKGMNADLALEVYIGRLEAAWAKALTELAALRASVVAGDRAPERETVESVVQHSRDTVVPPTIFGLPVVESDALNDVELPVIGSWCQRNYSCMKADGHEGDCCPYCLPGGWGPDHMNREQETGTTHRVLPENNWREVWHENCTAGDSRPYPMRHMGERLTIEDGSVLRLFVCLKCGARVFAGIDANNRLTHRTADD